MQRGSFIAILIGASAPSHAVGIDDARDHCSSWFERTQNHDGSWGAGPTRALATAEAILALERTGHGGNVTATRAVAWLRRQELQSVDYRSRRVRALAALGIGDAGREAEALDQLRTAAGAEGWGPTGAEGPSSLDTALALDSLQEAGRLPAQTVVDALVQAVIDRQRDDDGWSGDGIPSADGASDLTVTAEVTRALQGTVNPARAEMQAAFARLEALVSPATPTLEVAARLLALRSHGRANAAVTALETELLDDDRFTVVSPYGPVWSTTDPFVNAIALLAVTPVSGLSSVGSVYADLDRDGIPNHLDPDRDGDGVPDGADAFASSPGEWSDLDGDGIGDAADFDDDGDGLSDLHEIAVRLDSLDPDTDRDRFTDGLDGHVLVSRLPDGWNLDGDGHVDGEADHGSDPLDPNDHPGKPGDVAPLGRPDARIDAADALVATRIIGDPSVLPSLSGQNRAIAELAVDEDGNGQRELGDAVRILGRARNALAAP